MTPPLDDFARSDPFASPEPPAPPAAAKVFVRTLSTPAGLPWEQARAADLEARHGAPIPIQDVALQLRRLEPWRPGRAARFAALYVPMRAVGERLETTVMIDGAPVEVVFLSPAAQAAQRRRLLMVAGGSAALVFLAASAIGAALSQREEAEVRLTNLETQTAARVRADKTAQQQRERAGALDVAPDRGAPVSQVMADLAWASAMRAPDAQIEAFHWERGAMALEARGAESPLPAPSGRTLQRSAKPLRRGVWLWVVTPLDRHSGVGSPTVAEPRDGGARR